MSSKHTHDSDARMRKFTAGPWEYRVDYGNKYIVSGDEGTSGNAYGEANARLIAAAPDLLEALEGLVFNSTPHNQQMQLRALEVIARAKGESDE